MNPQDFDALQHAWPQDPVVWAEIDLAAIAHNVSRLRQLTHAKARLMAVVKADAYGHGAVEVARCALSHGAQALGVARWHEALPLRAAGIQVPILVFTPTPPSQVPLLAELALIQTVSSLAYGQALSQQAQSVGLILPIHLKVDSGMGRSGWVLSADAAQTAETVRQIAQVVDLPGLSYEGLFTHFASADESDKTYTLRQLARFNELIEQLAQRDLVPVCVHAANSAALIDLPDAHFDMVRPGIAIYGLAPSCHVGLDKARLRPAMTVKSRVVQVKEVPAGHNVSYGSTYTTPRPTRIATVPMGYADGYNRLHSNNGVMLVGGQRAPVIGRVCMDLILLDVGQIPDVGLFDEVVVLGVQGTAQVSADEIANQRQTINYEVTCNFSQRVPRHHFQIKT